MTHYPKGSFALWTMLTSGKEPTWRVALKAALVTALFLGAWYVLPMFGGNR